MTERIDRPDDSGAPERDPAFAPIEGPLDCAGVMARLPLHVGGDLEPEAERAVDAHLESCEDCRRGLERARELRQTYFTAASSEAPVDLWPGVRSALIVEGRLAPAERARPARRQPLVPTGATVSEVPAAPTLEGTASGRLLRLRVPLAVGGTAAAAGVIWMATLVAPLGGHAPDASAEIAGGAPSVVELPAADAVAPGLETPGLKPITHDERLLLTRQPTLGNGSQQLGTGPEALASGVR